MLNETQLKEKLAALAQKKFQPETEGEIEALVPDMLRCIGAADPELRDHLIYVAFWSWILKQQRFTGDELHFLTLTALDDRHLFFGIGEEESDSVFTRTFSMLLIPLLLIRHRSQPFLSKDEVIQIKDSLLRYFSEEKDQRGYVDGKGWAHSTAHASDALDDLAQCSELGRPDLAQILEALRPLVCRQDAVYQYGEEERMATPTLAVIRRGLLTTEDLSHWIQMLGGAEKSVEPLPIQLIVRSNVKNFLQSLYFRLRWEAPEHALLPVIDQVLNAMNPYRP